MVIVCGGVFFDFFLSTMQKFIAQTLNHLQTYPILFSFYLFCWKKLLVNIFKLKKKINSILKKNNKKI